MLPVLALCAMHARRTKLCQDAPHGANRLKSLASDMLVRAQIGPVLSAYVKELVKLVPGTGFYTSVFAVQDALEPLLDNNGTQGPRIINRALQVYGSGNQTINILYDTPVTPY